MSAGSPLETNVQILSYLVPCITTTGQGNAATFAGTDPSIVNALVTSLVPGSCVGVWVLAPSILGQRVGQPLFGRWGCPLRLQSSLAFSEGSECLGNWCLRPPGVMSCLPSEGAGSGARPHLLSVPELCRYLAESWLTFQIHLQELLQYKRQNPAQVIFAMSRSGCLHCGEIEMGRSNSNPLAGD